MNHFTGLIAAPFAPLDQNGTLNLSAVGPYVEHLLYDGVKGIFVCGSNGEGPNLTIEERMQVTEAFAQAVAKRMRVFIHVGHSSISECRKLAAHAQAVGADAISAVAAFYFRPASVANLVDCMADIASAAPQLPFYYYHIPHLTGVGMDMVEFLRLGEEQIPNLAGIKYTASTLHEYQACLSYRGGKFDILFGMDEMLLSALAIGAQGAIGSTYSFAAPFYRQVMEAYQSGNPEEARETMAYLVNIVKTILQFPPIPSQKAVMKMLGIDLGPSRLPLVNLTAAQYEKIQSDLTSVGFWERRKAASRQIAVLAQA